MIQLQQELLIELIGKAISRAFSEVARHLLVQLALKNLLCLAAMKISGLIVCIPHGLKHHLKERFPDKTLKRTFQFTGSLNGIGGGLCI